jgi:hypothetical protein
VHGLRGLGIIQNVSDSEGKRERLGEGRIERGRGRERGRREKEREGEGRRERDCLLLFVCERVERKRITGCFKC